MINTKVGRWTIIEETDKPLGYKHSGKWYLCKCECGTIRKVKHNSLRQGRSKSCGCLRKDSYPKGKDHHRYKHGHARKNKRTKEWRAWDSMIRRVRYPSMDRYPRYGGRGIKVCDRWINSFENFLDDVGYAPSKQHTLDRIDNDGDYTPDNVRWATRSQQVKNSTKAKLITYNGKTMNLCDWVAETGIKRTTIQMRLKKGWSIHDTLTTPVRKRGKNENQRTH